MKANENESRSIQVVQLLKSIALLILYSSVIVMLSVFMCRQWQALTGIDWPLFVVAEAAAIVAAYWLDWLPSAKGLFSQRRSE